MLRVLVIRCLMQLKTILHSNYFYILLLLVLGIYCFNYYSNDHNSTLINDTEFVGNIINYKIDQDLVTIELAGHEKIIAYYYLNSLEALNEFKNKYQLGDKVLLKGNFEVPNNNTIPSLFNYRKYLKYKHIYVVMNVKNITKLNHNKNLFYHIKNKIIKHISHYKSSAYLNTFILGNTDMIDTSSYRENGISHLFAISGFHIAIFLFVLGFLIEKLFFVKRIKYILFIVFLLYLMFLTGFSMSVIRASIFTILFSCFVDCFRF